MKRIAYSSLVSLITTLGCGIAATPEVEHKRASAICSNRSLEEYCQAEDCGKIVFSNVNHELDFRVVHHAKPLGEIKTLKEFALQAVPSYDGRLLVYKTSEWGHLDVMTENGEEVLHTFIEAQSHDQTPKWENSNSAFIYHERRGNTGKFYYCVIRFDLETKTETLQKYLSLHSSSSENALELYDGNAVPCADKIFFSGSLCGMHYCTDIYSMNRDGTDVKKLTSGYAFDGDAECSPDETKIAFRSYNSDYSNAGNISIFTMDLDGSNQENVTQAEENEYHGKLRWSPDGQNISYLSGRVEYGIEGSIIQLEIVNVNTKQKRVLVNYERTPSKENIAFSPDGCFIAYSEELWPVKKTIIAAVNVQSGTKTLLWEADRIHEGSLFWSP